MVRLSKPDAMTAGLCLSNPMAAIDHLALRLGQRGCHRFYSMWMWPVMFLKGYK